MKNLFILLMLCNLNSFAQNYQAQIAEHRENYKEDFLVNAHSPLVKEDLKELHFFDADSTYNVVAKVELLTNEETFPMPTYNGASHEYIRYAKLKFTLNGTDQQLILYQNLALSKKLEYRDHLFLPFTDETNSSETYTGGRYVDLSSADIKDGQMQVDFNKAYNPYCAYSDGYQCPKPPQENHLSLSVKAGEMQYTGVKKH